MTLLSGLTFSALTPVALRAFHPCPESGTLYGPCGFSDESLLINSQEHALAINTFTALAMSEVGELHALQEGADIQLPFNIDTTSSDRGTPWELTSLKAKHTAGIVTHAMFRSIDPQRTLAIETPNLELTRYTYTLGTSSVAISQSILLGLDHLPVCTDGYTIKGRTTSFERAVETALAMATLVYRSTQFAPHELGSFQYRTSSNASYYPIKQHRGRFLSPVGMNNQMDEILLRSELRRHDKSPARAALSIRLHKINDDHEANASPHWDAAIQLRRPLSRVSPFMPLVHRLRERFYKPMLDEIFKRRSQPPAAYSQIPPAP